MLEYLRRDCHNCKRRHDPTCPNSHFCWVETDEARTKREQLIERVDKIEEFLAYAVFCVIAICLLSVVLITISVLVRGLTNA